MPPKGKFIYSGSDDTMSSFEDEHDILNFRPTIKFVQPDQQPLNDVANFDSQGPQSIDDFRKRTEELIKQYDIIRNLADQAQKKIDKKVKTSGGLEMKLDPVADATVISAIRKQFPDVKDPAIISYDQYKHCLKHMSQQQPVLPIINDEAIKTARSNPNRIDFGGLNNQHGENRPEISSTASSIKPINLEAFQAAGILSIFLMMRPFIKLEDTAEILQHLATVPHKPI